jgi:flagellar motor switch protein FliM
MHKLSAHYWLNTKKVRDNTADLNALRKSLSRAALPVAAQLGSSAISVGEFLQLAIGDVIKLDQDIQQKVEINVGENRKFLGQPGVSRGRIAVQVTEVLEEEVKEDD